ncbi:amidase [Terrarubrum flagellatum]|uniref:amidase n=1 Tax=Terrirubrum flagellatum TaxID=2895980 RepID=UPI0031451EA1
MNTPAHDLTACELAGAIARGSVSASEAVAAAYARIDELEPKVRAWAWLDRENAAKTAAAMTDEARAGRLRGPLHGVPVGVKDVFHVEGMPTVANSKTTDPAARYPDSGVAASLRAAGAIIIGKCETVEFAGMGIPPETRNPWNLAHTAGGSSSGSGAAVGARMAPATIGTQTGGSNLRPAAYNGVAGFKPSYGALSRSGCLPVSWSLDHPGVIARAAEDLPLMFNAIAKQSLAPQSSERSWRFGLLRGYFLEKSDSDTVSAVEDAARKLAAKGATITELKLPPLFSSFQAIHRLIMNPEMITYHATRLATDRDRMSARHRLSVEAFSLVPASYYLQALRARRMLAEQLMMLFEEVDILIMPTAPGPAPEGLQSTGDASLLSPWSLVGFPAATTPCGLSSNGLPLGLQLVGPRNGDQTVLASAIFAEKVLGRLSLPF